MLQAYIDESFNRERSIFVLGGYVSPAARWATFTHDWSEILTFTRLRDKSGEPYFHMTELAARSDGLEIAQAFYRVIEKHCELALSAKVDKRELENAIGRIVVPNFEIDWHWWRNPYNAAFRILMDMFHTQWAASAQKYTLSENGPVEFVFDDKSEKDAILASWKDFMSNKSSSVRHLYSEHPKFRNDKQCKPLQAADFWCWWRRRWYEQNQEPFTFGPWAKDPNRIAYVMDIEYTEDQLVASFAKLIRSQLGPGPSMFDSKTGKAI